jgi:hypothetical protein
MWLPRLLYCGIDAIAAGCTNWPFRGPLRGMKASGAAFSIEMGWRGHRLARAISASQLALLLGGCGPAFEAPEMEFVENDVKPKRIGSSIENFECDGAVACPLDPETLIFPLTFGVVHQSDETPIDFSISNLGDPDLPLVDDGPENPMRYVDEVFATCRTLFVASNAEPKELESGATFFFPADEVELPIGCAGVDGEASLTNPSCQAAWVDLANTLGDCVENSPTDRWQVRCRRLPIFVVSEHFFVSDASVLRVGLTTQVALGQATPPIILVRADYPQAWVHEIAHVLVDGGHVEECAESLPYCLEEPRTVERNILCGASGGGLARAFGVVPQPALFESTPCAPVDQCQRLREIAPRLLANANPMSADYDADPID